MAGIFTRLTNALTTARVPAKPYSEQGVAGFSAYGGYITTPETNVEVTGANRWHTAADILTNISIVAASVRYTLNLISRPKWRADPVSDKPDAKAAAEFVEEVLNGIDTGWSRIVRRSAAYRFHGFGMHEWVMKKRDDGKVGIASIEPRPPHTIYKWDIDENGGILGVIQVSPQTGQEIYLPRQKLVYLVDDALTDRPEGMGWFRHLADPAQRFRRYLKLETMGFERDLAGIPVARAPLQRINQLVADGKLSQKQADLMISSLQSFVRMQAKEPTTGLLLDSEPFRAKTETGETVSSVMQWGMELITGSATSAAALGQSIHRLMLDMALIMGTDSLLIGQSTRGGSSGGSKALSQDKSRNLYLTCNAAVSDMAEAFDRDIVTPLWVVNGMPEELRPKLKVEDVSFQDVGEIAKALADMATAGAILRPDDPAINDLRDMCGVSRQVDPTPEEIALMMGARTGPGAAPPQTGRPSRENPGSTGGPAPPNPKKGAGRARKIDPSERTLYIHRNLLNAEPLIAWAKANGFDTTLPAAEMHVTVAFSREPVDWSKVKAQTEHLTATGGARSVERLGDKGAVVLLFDSPELTARWQELRDLGASWDFPGYRPHVSITYQGDPDLDVSAITPYAGLLTFGPEVLGEVNEDWSDGVVEKDFDSGEARDDHGRWTRVGNDFVSDPNGEVSWVIEHNPETGKKRPFEVYTIRHDRDGQRVFRASYSSLESAQRAWPRAVHSPVTKYSPDQPRDDHGRWSDGGGGGAIVPLTRTVKSHLTAPNVGKSVGVMRSEATHNQQALDQIGAGIEQQGIASYEPPPPGYEVKSTDSVMRKMRDEGYAGPHEITDYSRASFVIDHPEDAPKVIDALRQRGDVYDKNWQYMQRSGYLDRKVYLQHPNGGLSEIQITPRGVFQAKMGEGHRLYEIARVPTTPRTVASAALRKSRNLYAKAISHTPFSRFARRAP